MAIATKKKTIVKLSNEIEPHFYKLWNTDKPYKILKGGRGSMKSATISIKLVVDMKKHIARGEKVNVACIRENEKNLRFSVYNQILWAINDIFHIGREFRAYKSPLMIVHKKSGSTFYFYGANDPDKLKSNITNDLMAVWFEEFSNNKSAEVFDSSLATFLRQKSPYCRHVDVYCSYNPPKNPYSWINQWIKDKKNDPDYFIDHSTYLDDVLGFTNKQQLRLINSYKKNDKDYYRWLYLGEVIGLGTNVYNMKLFHLVKKIPDDDPIMRLYYCMDNGYEVSATTCVCLGLSYKNNVYVLDTWYYSPAGKVNKMSASEYATAIHDFIDQKAVQYNMYPTNMTMDSADGAFNPEYYRQYGIYWHKVNKLKNYEMIDRVQDLLAQGRVHVLDIPDNQIFLEEHRRYQWDQDSMQTENPEVIKEHDHTCDAFKYGVLDNQQDFGLVY